MLNVKCWQSGAEMFQQCPVNQKETKQLIKRSVACLKVQIFLYSRGTQSCRGIDASTALREFRPFEGWIGRIFTVLSQ
ncbi:hypothetical protein D918_04380 [Trichuris suis]|nr:hypothetical protein D918_04380 [Trichuris suis]